MKKLMFFLVLLLPAVAVSAQTNRQVFEIASEAITQRNNAEDYLKNAGLKFVKDNTNDTYKPAAYLPSYYQCIRRAIYVDSQNRLWSYMSVGVPESSDGNWLITVQFEFSSSNALYADMTTAGFKQIGIDENTKDIIWRKFIRRYYSEMYDEEVEEYVTARMLVLNMGSQYIGVITFIV